MDSHQSTARILPIRAAVIPEVRKLDRPVFMEQAPLFAFLYYSPHLIIGQALCLFASCCIHPPDAQRLSTPKQMWTRNPASGATTIEAASVLSTGGPFQFTEWWMNDGG
jgi:hypothetical protein